MHICTRKWSYALTKDRASGNTATSGGNGSGRGPDADRTRGARYNGGIAM
eukprot:gene7626-biopygen13605